MPVFYRSDTRSPEEIFEHGFSTVQDAGEEWWHHAINVSASKGKYGIDNKAVDADANFTVCMSTKFESAALFPSKDDKSKGENVYVYAIALPEATQITYEKKERNIFITNRIPPESHIDKFKNSYVIVFNPRSLNYVTPEGKIEKLNYPASEFSLDDDMSNQMNIDNIIDSAIRRPGFKQIEPVKNILKHEEMDYIWQEISKINPLHQQKNNITFITHETTPANNIDMVLDLHQLQARQASAIVNRVYKQGLFDKNTSAQAAWPLYAYEALAHHVSPQNIIGAVKVHREERKNEIVVGESATHPEKMESLDRHFTVQEEMQLNNNFNPHQSLKVGRKGDTRIIEVDYSKDKMIATTRFQKAKEENTMETPNIYFGLGGKTF